MKKIALFIFACLTIQCSSEMQEAPVAKKLKKILEIHDDQRIDNYFWMRLSDEQKEAEQPDQQTQDVLDYLHAENDYCKYVMKPSVGQLMVSDAEKAWVRSFSSYHCAHSILHSSISTLNYRVLLPGIRSQVLFKIVH